MDQQTVDEASDGSEHTVDEAMDEHTADEASDDTVDETMDEVLVAFGVMSPSSRAVYRQTWMEGIDLEITPRTIARSFLQLNFHKDLLPEESIGSNCPAEERMMTPLPNDLTDDTDERLTTPLPDVLIEDTFEHPMTPLPNELCRFLRSPTPPPVINPLNYPQPTTSPGNPFFQAVQDDPVYMPTSSPGNPFVDAGQDYPVDKPTTSPGNPFFQEGQDYPVDIIEGSGDSDYELDVSPVVQAARTQETAADELEEGEILD